MLCAVPEELVSEAEAEVGFGSVMMLWLMTVVITVEPEASVDVTTLLDSCVTVMDFGVDEVLDDDVDVESVKALGELELGSDELVLSPSSTV